jgi:hypothetical protein
MKKAQNANYLIRAWRATGRGTLPILFLDGRAIGDSTHAVGGRHAVAHVHNYFAISTHPIAFRRSQQLCREVRHRGCAALTL